MCHHFAAVLFDGIYSSVQPINQLGWQMISSRGTTKPQLRCEVINPIRPSGTFPVWEGKY